MASAGSVLRLKDYIYIYIDSESWFRFMSELCVAKIITVRASSMCEKNALKLMYQPAMLPAVAASEPNKNQKPHVCVQSARYPTRVQRNASPVIRVRSRCFV